MLILPSHSHPALNPFIHRTFVGEGKGEGSVRVKFKHTLPTLTKLYEYALALKGLAIERTVRCIYCIGII